MPDPIEWSQVWIVNWATGLVSVLPLSYAFAAGMVSTVNPCGFAMLPAYLSLYLGSDGPGSTKVSTLNRVVTASRVGVFATLGFIVLFGVVGLAIAAGGHFLMRAMPWAGLLTGVVLAVVGVSMLFGLRIHSALLARLGSRIGDPRESGSRAFFLFGIGYAVASLACTLPIFLVVVGSAIASTGIVGGFYQFISYSMGMGLVLVLLALGMAVFRSSAVGPFRRILPYVERTSSVLLLLMGGYLAYYWLIKGGLMT